MKATPRILIFRLISFLISLTMIFQSAASVQGATTNTGSSSADQAKQTRPVKKPMHWRLNEIAQKQIISPTAPTTATVTVKKSAGGWGPNLLDTYTILNESFEGSFPTNNGWTLNDASTTDGGDYLWGPVTKYARTGTHSAWVAAGGANGYQPGTTSSTYPNNMNTAMVYGPFSLADANSGRIDFYYRGSVPMFGQQDGGGIGASIDGTNFTGFTFGGSSSWSTDYLDFSNVDGSNTSFIGEANVWIMFVFQSDGTSSTNEGIYIDDVVITKDSNTTPTCYTLSTSASPTAGGSVGASPSPNCNGNQYTSGMVVTLTATANSGYAFSSWSGDASGSTSPTTVTMNSNKTVAANFTQQTCYTLNTMVNPSGGGTITRNVQPNCNNGTQYTAGTQVQLTASPSTNYTFGSWSGDASGTSTTVTVTMNSAKSVTANFNPVCYTLNVAINPSAGGTVTRNVQPSCNNNTQYPAGAQVQLTASANSGYTFNNWTGDASGTSATVTVTMDSAKNVTANFTQQVACYTLNTQVSPSGSGTIARNVQPNCNNNTGYSAGTQVQLTASVSSGYSFGSWSGDASGGSATVTVTMDNNKTVTANFTQICYTLTTQVTPSNSGTISRNVQPSCNNNTQYPAGTQVQLTANPSTNYNFANWTGDASGTSATVTITMDGPKTVTANFSQICYTLTASANPSSGGSISRNVQPTCNNNTQYPVGTQVQLTATANTGSSFINWSGDASGTSTIVTVTMDGNKTVTANFEIQCFTLNVSVAPSGGGTVSRNVQPTCNNNTQYTYGTQVQLTANPSTNYTFASWTGDASGTSTTVTVTMNSAKSVTANFNPVCYTLTTSVSPNGSGNVTRSAQPNCNSGTQYSAGTQVQLTASAATGYTFNNWSGGATGTATTVTVTMDQNRTVTANFNQQCFTLTLSVSPSGGGTVTRSVQPSCNNNTEYPYGTQVQLTASANSGYTFNNWTGDATGTTTPVTVTMTANRTVTANFNALPCYTLTTSVAPTGTGTITRNVQPNCNNNTGYIAGTQVQLTANPNTGYGLNNWSGDATGSATTVIVTMDGNKTVTANFRQLCYTLTVSTNPSAGGTVARNVQPNCNNNTQYSYGTQVQLTESPNTGYTFGSWSGDASGPTATVTVTMTANRTVTANFNQLCYTLTVSSSPTAGGTVTRSAQPTCNNNTQYPYGTQVQLTANASTGYTFAHWSGDSTSSSNTVTVTMTANHTYTANFDINCYTLTLVVAPANSGTVNRSPAPNCNNGTQYTYNTSVQLTPSPAAGYGFSYWSGDLTGSASPATIAMTADRSVTANFTTNNPVPTLTKINPTVIFTGAKDTVLVLTGTNFVPNSVVRWNGTALTGVQYVSATELRVTIPAARLTTPGTIHITVFNPAPAGGTTSAIDLIIVDPIPLYLPFVVR